MVEEKVLAGLRDRLLAPDLIKEFVEENLREYNRLMQQERSAQRANVNELAQVRRKIAQVVEVIADGMFQPSMNAKLDELEASRSSSAILRSTSRSARIRPQRHLSGD